MDLIAIQAAISSLKSATDIARSLLEMKSMSEIQGKVIELQSALLQAQNCALSATTAQFELQERVRLLEAQLREKADWETEKSRYRLVSPWIGPAQVYALTQAAANGEEPHFLCTSCFHDGKRIILIPVSQEGWLQMVCPACKATMATGYQTLGAANYAEAY